MPLLEFALTQLWERQVNRRLTHDAYQHIGGVNQALAGMLIQCMRILRRNNENACAGFFVQLVRPGQGTEDTRQIATREQVGADNWELVTKLADARLVVTSSTTSVSLAKQIPSREGTGVGIEGVAVHQDTVEVVHEALIQAGQPLRE